MHLVTSKDDVVFGATWRTLKSYLRPDSETMPADGTDVLGLDDSAQVHAGFSFV